MTDQPTEHNGGACEEYERLSRRGFLTPARAAAALASAPAWLPQVTLAAPGTAAQRDVLVTIFLRGAMDGLTACVPYGDADLYNLRPNLAIAPPGQPDGATDLDGFFGLPPSGSPLHTPYADGRLLLVHASGSTDPSRSHFDATYTMETGIAPNGPGSELSSGWVARHLQTSTPVGNGDFRGIALGSLMPRILAEAPATLPIPNPGAFDFPGNAMSANARRSALENMYAGARAPMGGAAASTLATIDLLDTIDFAGYVPENGAVYSSHYLHQAFMRSAALIKANVGVEALHLDLGGWDHHENQGPVNGVFANLMDVYAKGIEAFYLDLLNHWDGITLVANSEFGRRAGENGSLGTDHGHGNVMFVLGGHIDGGRVLAQWPGLAPGSLNDGDLEITIDYRDILSEIVQVRLGNTNLSTVFPGYTPNFQNITI